MSMEHSRINKFGKIEKSFSAPIHIEMDKVITLNKQVNIISNIVIRPEIRPVQAKQATESFRDTSRENVHNLTTEVPGKDTTLEATTSTFFKNLCFELPPQKRKNSCDEQENDKKVKIEDTEQKIFNYLTGSYEIAEGEMNEEPPEDYVESKEEVVKIEEHTLDQNQKREESPHHEVEIIDPGIAEYWVNSHEVDNEVGDSNAVDDNNSVLEGSLVGNNMDIRPCPNTKQHQSNDSHLEGLLLRQVTSLKNKFKENDKYVNELPLVLDEQGSTQGKQVTEIGENWDVIRYVDINNIIANHNDLECPIDANNSYPYLVDVLPSLNDFKDQSNSKILEGLLKSNSKYIHNVSLVGGSGIQKESVKSNSIIDLTESSKNSLILNASPPRALNTKSLLQSHNQSLLPPSYLSLNKANNVKSISSNVFVLVDDVQYPKIPGLNSLKSPSSKSNSVASSDKTQKLKSPQQKELRRLLSTNQLGDLSKESEKTKANSYPYSKFRNKKFNDLWLYECRTCFYIAKTERDLISHMYNLHLKKDFIIKCKYCEFECEDQRQMEQHVIKHRGSVTGPKSRNNNVSENTRLKTSGKGGRNIHEEDASGSSSLPLSDVNVKSLRNRAGRILYTKSQIDYRNHRNNKSNWLPQVQKKQDGKTSCVENNQALAPAVRNLASAAKNVNTNQQNSNNLNADASDSVPIKCFDCDNMFETKNELKDHAFLIHSMSLFRCDLHSKNDNSNICSKCSYASILKSIQRDEDQQNQELSSSLGPIQEVIESPSALGHNEIRICGPSSNNELIKSKGSKGVHADVENRSLNKSNTSESMLLNLLTIQGRRTKGNENIHINKSGRNQGNAVVVNRGTKNYIVDELKTNSTNIMPSIILNIESEDEEIANDTRTEKSFPQSKKLDISPADQCIAYPTIYIG